MPFLPLIPSPTAAGLSLAGLIASLLLLVEAGHRLRGWSTETCRQAVHVSVGLLVAASPVLFEERLVPLILGIVFVIGNAVALRTRLTRAILATDRTTLGTVYFPAAFSILVLGWWERPITLVAAWLCLTLADPIAALVGRGARMPKMFILWRDSKSVQGSLAMCVSCAMIVTAATIGLRKWSGLPSLPVASLFLVAVSVASLATLAEACSSRGSDNLTVPLVTAIAYDLFLAAAESGTLPPMLGWMAFSLALAWGSFRIGALSSSGASGAFILGTLLFGAGAWKTMVPMVAFFVLSSVLSHLPIQGETARAAPSRPRRTAAQVFANGGVPLSFALAGYYYGWPNLLYQAFLASTAAAAADTWGTEIGTRSRQDPINIVTLRRVERGASGGITLSGMAATVMGSASVAGSALAIGESARLIALPLVAGVFGAVVDSLLGATLQARFKCEICGKIVEENYHCGKAAHHRSGWKPMSNDAVNVACTVSAGASLILWTLLT